VLLSRKYAPGSRDLQQKPVCYNDFTEIRKKHRPNIRTHRRKKKKSGWNLLVCGTCEILKREKYAAKRGSKERAAAQKRLDDHYDNEEVARREYYKTR
jgi:hypothetical protein